MKIAILAFSSIPKMGGAEIFTQNLIKYLKKEGHEVDLYLPRYFYRKYIKLPIDSQNVYPIFYRELGILRRYPFVVNFKLYLNQLIRKYDVWQVVGAHPAAHALRLVSCKTPVVVRAFGADIQKEVSINYGFRLEKNVDRQIRKTLSLVARVTALTPSLVDDFKSLGVSMNKITEIPNGVDIKRFNSIPPINLKSQLGMEKEEILILTTGRYHIKKGFEYIPEAVRTLVDKGYKFKWLLIGKGLEKLDYLIEKFNVSKVLLRKDEIGGEKGEFSLNVPGRELIELYKSVDIYSLPSLIEGMSNAMLEAMAAGLPVVTTDSPGCRDLVKDGINGLLAKPKSSSSLAEKVEMLFDLEYSNKLRTSVKTYITQHSWDKIGNMYLNVYKELTQ